MKSKYESANPLICLGAVETLKNPAPPLPPIKICSDVQQQFINEWFKHDLLSKNKASIMSYSE